MNDYTLNWKCATHLRSFECLSKVEFNINYQMESDLKFEQWCIRRIAQISNDESWCEDIILNLDGECYKSLASQKKNKKLCMKITNGDVPIMRCLQLLAIDKNDTHICKMMKHWYVGKGSGITENISEWISQDFEDNCTRTINEELNKKLWHR